MILLQMNIVNSMLLVNYFQYYFHPVTQVDKLQPYLCHCNQNTKVMEFFAVISVTAIASAIVNILTSSKKTR